MLQDRNADDRFRVRDEHQIDSASDYLIEPLGHYVADQYSKEGHVRKNQVCLACQSVLHEPKNEFIEVDLNPSMEWKAK